MVAKLRARRLRWAGQVLRQGIEQSLVKQVMLALANHDLEQQNSNRGSLLMDAPFRVYNNGRAAQVGCRHSWVGH